MKGFSQRNLRYMRACAVASPHRDFCRHAAANVPWGHVRRLRDSVPDHAIRAWYAQKAVAHGWSRAVLAHQIETTLYERQGKAQTNFTRALPAPPSDLAQQILKDPYNVEFLSLGEEARERGLVAHIQHFLLELGVGFASLGSQYRVAVAGRDYFIDLLFSHVKLRSYVAIDVKVVDFEPELAGKMNVYLSAVDDAPRHPDDQPSIGLILCKSKSQVVAEYALRAMTKPIGVLASQLTAALPEQLHGSLPTIEELEPTLGEVETAQCGSDALSPCPLQLPREGCPPCSMLESERHPGAGTGRSRHR